MKTTTGTLDELRARIMAVDPLMVNAFLDERLIIFEEVNKVCWCCGGIRVEQHFITWGNGCTYDHIRGFCIEPFVQDACQYAVFGSQENAKCPFKNGPKAVCK